MTNIVLPILILWLFGVVRQVCLLYMNFPNKITHKTLKDEESIMANSDSLFRLFLRGATGDDEQ